MQTGYAADPTAVMGRRIGAYFIDVLIYVVVAAVIFFLLADSIDSELADFVGGTKVSLGDTTYLLEGGNALGYWVFQIAFSFLLYVVIQAAAGGSPGKLAVGLRVVDEQGAHAGFAKNLVRWLLWIVDAFPYCFPIVGLATGLSSSGHRRVGDMVAKTNVVGKESVGTPPMQGGGSSAPGGYPPSPYAGPAPPSQPYQPPAPQYQQPQYQQPQYQQPPPQQPAGHQTVVTGQGGGNEPSGEAVWNAEHNAWLRWDDQGRRWYRHDDARQQWVPLDS